jgi:SH3 domain-containing YSC84-like protein 1
MQTRRTSTLSIVPAVLLCLASVATGQTEPRSQSDEARRVREAATVFAQVMNAPDKAIPQAILDKADAVAVFPSVIKAAFIVGGERGKGVISVRNRTTNSWSAPAFLTLTGGSWGAQIGGRSADIVLVVMNAAGVEKLMQSQFKIGGDAEAAAGPVGRRAGADTDIQLQAGILSYSRSRGLFAGVSLNGASVHEDIDANESFYGQRLHTREVTLRGAKPAGAAPQAVAAWRDTLSKYFMSDRAATSGRKEPR